MSRFALPVPAHLTEEETGLSQVEQLPKAHTAGERSVLPHPDRKTQRCLIGSGS